MNNDLQSGPFYPRHGVKGTGWLKFLKQVLQKLDEALKFFHIPTFVDKYLAGKWHRKDFILLLLLSQEVLKTKILVRFTPSYPI